MKICKICGNQIEDYAVFCTNCGATVETQEQVQQPVNNYDYYAQPEVEATEEVKETEVVIDETTTAEFEKAAKSAKLMSIIALCISGVLLFCAGFTVITAFLFAFLNYLTLPFTGILAIAAIVLTILFFINFKKVKALLKVDATTIDPLFTDRIEKVIKDAKLSKTLGLVSIILLVLDILELAFVIIWPLIWLIICAIFGFSGALFDLF
ncbi:MAG: zinc ribbon domain-containing protein [Acutalibacteraceae bacterium]|nr:zinc ribbon domain-containing protein [Acutalibacteraceae bacterium]